MLSEKSFATAQLTLSYGEGPRTGPPLLLLHGLAGDRRSWDVFFPVLASGWHLFACDLRGHGSSGRVAGRYHLSDYVQDVVAFLEHLPEPATVMAHSLGALVALGAAAVRLERVRALVLLDPPLFNRKLSIDATPAFKEWFGWAYETTSGARSYADVEASCRAMIAGADEATITDTAQTLYKLDPDTVGAVLHDQLFDGFDLTQVLRRVACPTLLLRGEWEYGSAVRDEDAEHVQASLRGVTLIKIPGAGHFFLWEQQELVLQHVNEFLNPVPDGKL